MPIIRGLQGAQLNKHDDVEIRQKLFLKDVFPVGPSVNMIPTALFRGNIKTVKDEAKVDFSHYRSRDCFKPG